MLSGSHYASDPQGGVTLAGVTLGEWMQRVDDSLAALNDAIHVQALSQAAQDRQQAELHTALNALGANLPAPTLDRLLTEAPNPPQRGRPTPPDERTLYDLRTADAREDDADAQLALRIDNLLDAHEHLAQRVYALEAANKALREAVERHADLLQHYRLQAGI